LSGGEDQSYSVKLDVFEGPLDLLLHLIRKNELDIYDIPIALITRQYLDYLKFLKELNLDLVGDFLVMASTLLQIKSRMLLPVEESEEGEEEQEDPRAELVRRLIEYQRYRDAGLELGTRELLGREVFVRPVDDAEFPGLGDQPGEANAAGTEHAALRVMDHAASEVHFFRLEHRLDRHPALLAIVRHVEVLQLAFTGLIADRAVDRVIDQLQFHDVALDPLDVVHIQKNFHAFSSPGFTGGHNRRAPVLDADQAQTAVAVGTQGRVIAEMGNFDTDSAKRINQVFP
jgi:hypothetical protein